MWCSQHVNQWTCGTFYRTIHYFCCLLAAFWQSGSKQKVILADKTVSPHIPRLHHDFINWHENTSGTHENTQVRNTRKPTLRRQRQEEFQASQGHLWDPDSKQQQNRIITIKKNTKEENSLKKIQWVKWSKPDYEPVAGTIVTADICL